VARIGGLEWMVGLPVQSPEAAQVAEAKRWEIDPLYQRVADDLDTLFRTVGLRIAT
jgi:hypothetical protein